MDHVITVKDLFIVGGVAAALVTVGGFVLWFLAQLNSDL